MPVVALPASNTERWWLDYTVNGDAHSMLCRTPDDAVAAGVSDAFGDLLQTLPGTALYSFSAMALRRALRGSDVTAPFPYTGTAPNGTGTAIATNDRALTLSITGRDLVGHKARIFIFGSKFVAPGTYRLARADNANIAAFLDQLASETGYFLSIGGNPPVWNQYGNVGYNDHWIDQARG